MSVAHPANPTTPPDGSEKMLSYEVHFFRADGTLSLRLHTAAATSEDVMRALGRMRSGEFVEMKVWRGLNRAVVHHRPALSEEPGQAGRNPLRGSENS